MAKAKGAARPRPAASAPRRSGGQSDLARRASRAADAVFSPYGVAVAAVAIFFVAVPYGDALGVLRDFRAAVVRGTGLVCLALPPDALALVLVPCLLPRVRRSRVYWRTAAGTQALGLFLWGLLGFLRPHSALAGVSLTDNTAGGAAGHLLASTPIGLLVWLAALAGGCWLISPAGSERALRQLPPLARRLWALRLPHRAWSLAVALWRRGEAVHPVPVDERIQEIASSPSTLEDEPPDETLGQGAAEAFKRAAPRAHREAAAKAAAVAVAEPEPVIAPPVEPNGWTWTLPGSQILHAAPVAKVSAVDNEARAKTIVDTLASFHVDARVVQINQGPTVTQFGIEPGWEVKTRTEVERGPDGKPLFDRDGRPKLRSEEVSRTRVQVRQVTKLQNDLALALAASSIRIEAPVPGKSVIGIEVPNTTSAMVSLRSVVESPQFSKMEARSKLALALGMGVSGEAIVADLAKMPHLLIAGSTGSGKSVCINALIACILMHATPEEVRFVMIDPKRVEMAAFGSIPHLALSRIVTDMDEVPGVLQAVILEMKDRYKKFEALRVRNLEAYNKHPGIGSKLPQWVVVIDELADLMMAVPFEVERQICQLAQLARATGIHLVVATQRPSVDVITGLIKANFPTRIAFAVSSQVDSRTILDTVGAEKLLGRGDMLFQPTDEMKPRRIQGVYVSDAEIERLVDFWAAERWEQLRPQTFDHLVDQAKSEQAAAEAPEQDEMLEKARALALEHSRVSTSMLQRRLRIGYPRAARLMDALEDEGIVERGGEGSSHEVIGGGDESVFGDL